MKYSYNWLKELSGTKKSPQQLAELLTMRAFELEGIKTEGKETQLEFSILPNRSHDALSHIGMAREICAIEGRKLKNLTFDVRSVLTFDVRKLKVEIKDKQLCPRYIGVVLENIKVGSSPKWIQERLLVSGIKPISSIVDITNYVMLETGQPLHAFDASTIKDQQSKINIVVRRAKKGEKIKLLDESERILTENDLVIADSKIPIALAGVIGGFASSINDKTTSIILESANFNSTNIRKTRTRHNIITESSHRFEREIDPNLAEMAIVRAIELIKEVCGAKIDVRAISDVYPKKVKSWQIKLDTNYVNNLLGENIPVAKIKKILENLGMEVKTLGNLVSELIVGIPTSRIDLKTQEDLIEEIGRIYGYENIKEQVPTVEIKTPPQNAKRNFENEMRDTLVGLGFSEVMNYSFYGQDDIDKSNLIAKDHTEIANPLSLDQQYLRTTFFVGLAKNIRQNLKYFDKFSIFEIGHVYSKEEEKAILAGAMVNTGNKKDLFFETKGKIQAVFTALGLKEIKFEKPATFGAFVHPARTAIIKFKNKVIGYLGEINPSILGGFGIKQRSAIFELDIVELIEMSLSSKKEYVAINKFPTVKRDISMFVGENTNFNEVITKIKEVGGKLVLDVELFDIFEKEGEKSLALRIEIGSREKTLTSEEIDAVMKKISSALEKDLKVKVRK